MKTARTYSSTREAFPQERFPAVFGPYRPPLYRTHRVLNAILWVSSVVLLVSMVYAPQLLEMAHG